jgi:hypothetical protein
MSGFARRSFALWNGKYGFLKPKMANDGEFYVLMHYKLLFRQIRIKA